MMKPRKAATGKELDDQFWMGDPYAGATQVDVLIMEGEFLLIGRQAKKGSNLIPPVSFVEAPDLEDKNKLWRYTLKPTGRMTLGASRRFDDIVPEMEVERDPFETVQSRYGYTWDDLSTLEDRNHWVAKSRLQIVDLKTKEVIAERIGYVFESGFGSKGQGSGRTPWSNVGGGYDGWKTNYCPPRKNPTDMRWILSVLHNIPFDD